MKVPKNMPRDLSQSLNTWQTTWQFYISKENQNLNNILLIGELKALVSTTIKSRKSP